MRRHLREIAPALRRSWRERSREILRVNGAGALVVAAAAWVGQWRYGNPLFYFHDLDISRGLLEGALTAASGFALCSAGVLFLLVGRQARSAAGAAEGTPGRARWWYAAGLVAAFLAADEVVMIHEALAWRLEFDLGVPKLFGSLDVDLYVFAVYLAGIAVVGVGWLPEVLRHPAATFWLLATVVCFAASQALDTIPWLELSEGQRRVVGPLEEGLKTLGSLNLLAFAVATLEDAIAARLGRGRPSL